MTTHLRILTATLLLAPAILGQTTTRETVSSTGVQGNSGAGRPRISSDGRYVTYSSPSSNLVAGDTNGQNDVFVHDRQNGQTTRVSVDSLGAQANGPSSRPDISADGRFVVFESSATNLVAGDTNGRSDIFVHDRQTAQTTRASLGAAGQQALLHCTICSVSGDGRFVTFETSDNALVPGDTCVGTDIFLRDRQSGTTTLVSASALPGQQFGSRWRARISADGSTVVFDSSALDLVLNDVNGFADAFVWTRLTGAMEIASLAGATTQGNHMSNEAGVSADGRFVVFTSLATNFGGGTGPGNGNNADVFVRDRQTGQTSCASVNSSGAGATDFAGGGSITDDGRLVAFWSLATNLVANDTNGVSDVFLRDRQTGTTERVSLSPSGLQARSLGWEPVVAGGGRYIAFTSVATNMVIPDNNGTADVFVRDLAATAVALAYGASCLGTSPIPAQAEAIGQPFVGNSSFGIGVCNGLPSSLSVLAVSLAPASTPVGNCLVALGGPVTLLTGGFTDIFGFAGLPFPIPANLGLVGFSFNAQYVVFNPNGQFLGFAELTQGLAITVN